MPCQIAQDFNNEPKWRKFAKSGHTAHGCNFTKYLARWRLPQCRQTFKSSPISHMLSDDAIPFSISISIFGLTLTTSTSSSVAAALVQSSMMSVSTINVCDATLFLNPKTLGSTTTGISNLDNIDSSRSSRSGIGFSYRWIFKTKQQPFQQYFLHLDRSLCIHF